MTNNDNKTTSSDLISEIEKLTNFIKSPDFGKMISYIETGVIEVKHILKFKEASPYIKYLVNSIKGKLKLNNSEDVSKVTDNMLNMSTGGNKNEISPIINNFMTIISNIEEMVKNRNLDELFKALDEGKIVAEDIGKLVESSKYLMPMIDKLESSIDIASIKNLLDKNTVIDAELVVSDVRNMIADIEKMVKEKNLKELSAALQEGKVTAEDIGKLVESNTYMVGILGKIENKLHLQGSSSELHNMASDIESIISDIKKMVKNNNLNELFPTLEEGEKLAKLVESNKFIMEAVDKIKSVLKQKGKASAPVKAEAMMMENNSDKPINLKLELTIPHNFPEPWLADVSNFLKLFKDGKLEELGAIVKKANGDMAHVVNLIESNKTLLQKTDALEEVLQAYEEKIKHRIQVIEKRGGILKQTLHLIGKTPTLFLSTVKAVASVLMINPAVVRDVSESVYYNIEFVEDLNALTRDIGKAAKKTVKKSVGKCFGHGAHVEAETPPIHMNEAANSNHTDIMDNQSHLRQEETAASLHA